MVVCGNDVRNTNAYHIVCPYGAMNILTAHYGRTLPEVETQDICPYG